MSGQFLGILIFMPGFIEDPIPLKFIMSCALTPG